MIDTKTEITDEQIDDLLTTAFEGGSNYWYMIDNTKTPFDGPAGEAWRKTPKGLTVEGLFIVDKEDVEEDGTYEDEILSGWLNRETVFAGLALFLKDHPEGWARFIEEQYDANDADAFLQLCLFKEVIFG